MLNKVIEILFNTKANTAGATAAGKSLTDLQKQTEAMRESEAAAARQADQDAQAAAQAQDVAAIKRQAIAQTLALAADAATKAAAGLREFSQELNEVDPDAAKNIEAVAKGFDLANVAAQGASLGASVGGPFGAAFGAVVLPAVSATIDEIKAAMMAQGQLDKLIGESPIVANRMRQVKEAMDMKKEIESWEKLTEQIKAAATEAALMAKVKAAENDTKVFLAQKGVEMARATGGDVNKAEELLRKAQEAAADSAKQEELRAAISANEVAVSELDTAQKSWFEMNIKYVEQSVDDLDELKKKMDETAKEIEGLKARKKIAEDNLYLAEKTAGFDDNKSNKQKFVTDLEKGQDTTVQSVENLINDVESKGGGDGAVQQAIADLKKAIADSALDPKELSDITVILANNRDRMLRLGVSFDVLDLVNKNMDDLIRKMQAYKSHQEEISNAIRRLEGPRAGTGDGFRFGGNE